MLTTWADNRWQAEPDTRSLMHPREFSKGALRPGGHESFVDFISDRPRDSQRRSAVLSDLWQLYLELKAANPGVTDREVVNAYHIQHPERPRLTTTALRNLRYRKSKSGKRQVAVGATSE